MRIELAFKHTNEARLRHDFRLHTDSIIRAITFDFAFWLLINFDHTILLVTCLYRTESENKAAGGSKTSRHKEKLCRAVDFRTRDWPKDALPSAIQYLENAWGDLIYLLDEKDHLHLQLSRDKFPKGSLK